ncbi:hypothetical protein RND71_037520 [Anisodus tanguticus]|uniref:Uncharacterized protein n=1 Tax=Anisodus tanguticus TaxID=243964 RepID=A0AAE1UYY6_9SOLA|nr:hypothetical protein RND71_037520 [Anisodus tanguticus]
MLLDNSSIIEDVKQDKSKRESNHPHQKISTFLKFNNKPHSLNTDIWEAQIRLSSDKKLNNDTTARINSPVRQNQYSSHISQTLKAATPIYKWTTLRDTPWLQKNLLNMKAKTQSQAIRVCHAKIRVE